jgi:hypothetical protein
MRYKPTRFIWAFLFVFRTLPIPSALAQIPGRELSSSGSTVIRMETEGMEAADPSGRLRADVQQWSRTLGTIPANSQPQGRPTSAGLVMVWMLKFAGDPGSLHAFVTTDRTSAICHVRTQAGAAAVSAIQGAMTRCTTELVVAANAAGSSSSPGLAAPATATPASPNKMAARPGAAPPPSSADQPPAYPENWSRVSSVMFRAIMTGGVGGSLVREFEPMILFQDGTYFEIDNRALEDVDLAAEKTARPVHWGTWRAQGTAYVFADGKGRPQDYRLGDGNLFVSFPAEAGGPLSMSYRNVTGGGNAALGSDIGSMIETGLTFSADGQFTSAQDVGRSGRSHPGGAGLGAAGTYKAQHHTIELHSSGGGSERRFFAYGSKNDPLVLSRDFIFIGDQGYTSRR